ncbi:MAG: glucose 1-dehydrogenase [Acidimicrobiales bacterium]|nr:glucose 1-dehydrogenase [Acidimicrobiales bacterium]
MFRLDNKVAVITGAASGIGLATAQRFTAAGAVVVMADIADGSSAAADLQASYVQCDVTDERAVDSLVTKTLEQHGRLDIMMNNAGVLGPGRGVLSDSMDDLRAMFEVNLIGVLHGIKAAGGVMGAGGTIINTASMGGLVGFPGISGYGSSKFAVVGLTKNAAIELGPKGIRVNCVCPTGVSTPMIGDAPENDHWAVRTQSLANQHVKRLATADEIAAAIHFLASDEAAMINGHSLAIDGGMGAGMSVQLAEAALGEPIHDDGGIFE